MLGHGSLIESRRPELSDDTAVKTTLTIVSAKRQWVSFDFHSVVRPRMARIQRVPTES